MARKKDKNPLRDELLEREVYITDEESFKRAVRAMNPIEKMMATRIYSELGLEDGFWSQKVIDINGSAEGRTFFVADFYIPELDLIIETDGKQHYTNPDQIKKDQSRLNFLTSMGYRLFRFNWDEVMKPDDDYDVIEFIFALHGSWYQKVEDILAKDHKEFAEIDAWLADPETQKKIAKSLEGKNEPTVL